MPESQSAVPENVPESAEDSKAEALNAAIVAAWIAFIALVVLAMTLFFRALQAIFVLARPALLAGTVAALGYASVKLFGSILVHYGGGFPAVILALAFVIITPASLLILAGDYGIWAVALSSAGLEFLAHIGIERAPPIVLALIPPLALAAVILNFLVHMDDVPESQNAQENERIKADEQESNGIGSPLVAGDNQPDYFHGHENDSSYHDHFTI